MNEYLVSLLSGAKEASYKTANAKTSDKNKAIEKISEYLKLYKDEILEANKCDISNAIKNGIRSQMIDRLTLDETRINEISKAVLEVMSLADPIGNVDSMWKRPNGLIIGKKRVPIGTIGIIFEARPNVTVDAAILCLKTGNACVLRGGKEAINTNIALVKIMKQALKTTGFDENTIQLIEDTSHDTAAEFMKMNEYLDLIIPRGGKNLIQSVLKNATVPVIETGTGNCHIYIDEFADTKMALSIVVNAKTSRPSVCNAAESLIVHKNIAEEFLPILANTFAELNVELRGCENSIKICPNMVCATEDDYYTEYNDLIMSVKITDSIDDAINHINKYNSKHSEAIVTNNYDNAQKFLQEVDAAAVYVNASTRFTDGNEFGFGAEIGISTQKMHARGPMGLNELTTVKYIIYGNGQIR